MPLDDSAVSGKPGMLTDLDYGPNRALSVRWVRALLDGGGDGVCVVDARGRAVRSNRAFQTLLGYSADQLAKTPFSAYTADTDIERNVLLWETCCQIREPPTRSTSGT